MSPSLHQPVRSLRIPEGEHPGPGRREERSGKEGLGLQEVALEDEVGEPPSKEEHCCPLDPVP